MSHSTMGHRIIKLTYELICAVAITCGSVRADERPNFILLMGDDHGWDEVAYNGHPHLKTPVLDEMAAQGLRLDRFFIQHIPLAHLLAAV